MKLRTRILQNFNLVHKHICVLQLHDSHKWHSFPPWFLTSYTLRTATFWKPLTWNKFHDDIDGVLVGADSNQLDDVDMVVLFQDVGLLEELPPGCRVNRLLARLDCHRRLSLLQSASMDVPKMTLEMDKGEKNWTLAITQNKCWFSQMGTNFEPGISLECLSTVLWNTKCSHIHYILLIINL